MEDLYVECLVAKKPRAVETVIKGVAYGLTALFLILGLLNVFFLIGFVIMFIVDFLAVPRLSVEYEYLYVSKSLQIDSIYSKERRKKNVEYDLEQMEIFAEEGAWQLDEYKNMQTVSRDFTSGEEGVRPWILIVHNGQAIDRVKLEPNDELIKVLKTVYPRKVFNIA
ncbi:MAG: hypothetical protein IJ075_03235 [Lachnospiraceae bacterium]|nr:hypothetical protein [Lachnospiraceae bacterium]MBQ9606161.1 hypothetical protein [Lachnospiraceae bacterium]